MLVLMLNLLLTHPVTEAKPMPADLCFLNYDDEETLEEANIATHQVVRAATEQKEAEAAWKINELLDKVELNP